MTKQKEILSEQESNGIKRCVMRCFSAYDMVAFHNWLGGLKYEDKCKRFIKEDGTETIYKQGYITEQKTELELVEEWRQKNYA